MASKKRILITGGAGYIGSHAMKEAVRFGYEAVAFDNLSLGHAWAVPKGALLKGDLAQESAILQALRKVKPVAVMHFASHAAVGESVVNPQKYYRENLTNAMNLFSAMLKTKVGYFIFSSTCATYGEPKEVPIPEEHPQDPVNPYGDSKLMIEKIVAWYGRAYGLKSTFLRYFNAAGADASGSIGEVHEPEAHLIPLVLDAALGRRKEITVFGTDYPTPDGTCIRDYIHVTDLAISHYLALKVMMEKGQGDAFNLGTGRGYSVKEVIAEAQRVTGKLIPVNFGPRRPGDPPELVGKTNKAEKILGWKPEHSNLENILKTAWAWHNNWFGKTAKPKAGKALSKRKPRGS